MLEPRFDDTSILVVGDVMLDLYYLGDSQRISPEAPVPIVKVNAIEERAGGAANVAINLSALGGRVSLIGLTGQDDNSERLKTILNKCQINHQLIGVAEACTTVKSRIVSRGQQLIRFDNEDNFAGFANATQTLLHRVGESIADVDAVIFSDYNKGCLVEIEKLIQLAKDANKPIFIDPKGTDFQRYCGATVLTPNYQEFIAVAGSCHDREALAAKAEQVRAHLKLDALTITLGDQGLLLIEKGQDPFYLSAEAHEVYDVTGAGDTVIAVLACAYASGVSLPLASRYANRAASLVVGKSGTATVTPKELFTVKDRRSEHRIFDEDALLQQVKAARQKKKRVVMTNGCFDIVHAGHIHYLEQAASYGDYLIVAVNDDASVARLKGKKRPINPLKQRLSLLSALRSVDWVVPFSEDTPLALISAVLPDFLIKGGDYRRDEIVGADAVQQNGGQVIVLDYLEGHSTSQLIERIRA